MPFLFFTMASFIKIYKFLLSKCRESYTLDERALSIMRIGISIILLVDIFIRSLSIKAFFTDEGILPVSALNESLWTTYSLSFHTLSGQLWWQIVLFVFNSICILFLLIGYRTKFFTFLCWIFLTSLQNRNPFILQSGDDLLRLVLFWGIFLPWGNYYSINKSNQSNNGHFNMAQIGYLFLVASVFFFSALRKTSPEWRIDGTAIYYALSLDQIKLPLGSLLYQFPNLMRFLTHLVFYIELIAPLLLISPFATKKIRLMGIICIVALFLGIASCLYVGLFYIIGLVCLIGLIPKETMDWLQKKYNVYDELNHGNSYHIENNNQSTFLSIFTSTLKSWFLISMISINLLLNLSQLEWFPYVINENLMNFTRIIKLDQNWGMFSPYILKDDGWYVFSGYTNDKKFIDIKHDVNEVSFAKPIHVVEEFESDRWRKFSENYTYNNNNFIRPHYCKYLIKKWNVEHPEKHITELNIFYMKEVSLPNYQTKPIEKLALCNCQDK